MSIEAGTLDLKFRSYLLDLLETRELTFTQIRKCVARDYRWKRYTRQEITKILTYMHKNGLINRRRMKEEEREDRGRFMYTITDRGLERRTYYRKKLQEQEKKTNGP